MRTGILSAAARLALGVGLLAGLASTALAQDEPRSGGTLRFATQGEPTTYDCHAGTSIVALQYLAPHYSTLLKFSQDNYPEIVGDLAREWSISDDGLTYSFTLHSDVKFHDGTTLTAEDVKATFERIANPPEGVVSVRRSAFEQLASIEVTGPDTIEFMLESAASGFLSNMASPWHCIYSAAKLADDSTYPGETIMGTGPFTFVEHAAGAYWRGDKFADYFEEGRPYVDGFEATMVAGPAVVNAIAGRQVDANFRLVSIPDRERITAVRDDVTFQTTPATSVTLLVINTARPPFDDVRVRRALSLAIDRDLGIDLLGDMASQRWHNVVFRHGHEYAPTEEELRQVPGFGTDVEANRAEARRLLEEAGVSNLSFTLLNRSIRIPYEPLGIFFIDQWREIGVEVTMDSQENAPWAQRLLAGEYEVAIDLNAPSGDDPTEVLIKYLPGSSINYTRIEDDRLVELYGLQNTTTDADERERLVKEFVDRVVELQYVIPTFNAERMVALDDRVRGWTVTPSFLVGLQLGNVWLAE